MKETMIAIVQAMVQLRDDPYVTHQEKSEGIVKEILNQKEKHTGEEIEKIFKVNTDLHLSTFIVKFIQSGAKIDN